MSRRLRLGWLLSKNLPHRRRATPQRSLVPFSRRLRLEPLEDRRLLSITVDTLLDEADGSIIDGDVSLRDAIALAPSDETIDFAPALTAGGPATILLTLGQLTIAKSLTIAGPGANLLTIDASGSDTTPAVNEGNGSRVFNVNDGNFAPDKTVTISDVTLTGGDNGVVGGIFGGGGGAIFSTEKLTLDGVTIVGNSTAGRGGAVASNTILDGAFLKLIDSTISGNSATGPGGGVYARVPLEVTRSTISGNTAGGVGGGIGANMSVAIDGSTISGNSGYAGGGIFGPATITNSTISGNSAAMRGGGVYSVGYLSVSSSTISGNTANFQGGGIFRLFGILTLLHSTVAHNICAFDSGGGIFLSGVSPVTLDHTIVANNQTAGADTDLGSSDAVTVDADFCLIEAPGFVAIAGVGNVVGVDPALSPLDDNGGPTLTHALLGWSPAIDAGDPMAMAGVGGVPVFDQRGNPFSRVRFGTIDIGAYETERNTILVDTLVDESDGDFSAEDLSLREAIEGANSTVPRDTIEFAPALTAGGPATILLILGELPITDSVVIRGPGDELLTIDASGSDPSPAIGDGSRVFLVNDGDPFALIDVEIIGLTLTGGDVTGKGGGIYSDETLTVTGVTITGNSATGDNGGGICSLGDLIVTDSTITGNSADFGGGIFSGHSELNLISSTISGNAAAIPAGNGGGIFGHYSVMTVTSSTISGNSANGGGGGLFLFGSSLVIAHSTIASNLADADGDGGFGGGIEVAAVVPFPYSLGHTIVADNFAALVADDIASIVAVPADFSLIEIPPPAGLFGVGNILGLDPLLGPLADNGGPTATHALLAFSPAIDSGDPAAMAGVAGVPSFDQRGLPFGRVFGPVIDIGALESQPDPLPLPGDYNLNGTVDAADYTVWSDTFGAVVPPFIGADGDGDGTVDDDDYDVWKTNFGNTLPMPASGSAVSMAAQRQLFPNSSGMMQSAPSAPSSTEVTSTLLMPPNSNPEAAVDLALAARNLGRQAAGPRRSDSGLSFSVLRHDDALMGWLASRIADALEQPWARTSSIDRNAATPRITGERLDARDDVFDLFASACTPVIA